MILFRLNEIKIKRISKYSAFKADELIKGIEDEMEEVKNHLANLIKLYHQLLSSK